MKYISIAFSLVLFAIMFSCGSDDNDNNLDDYVGTYDVLKSSGFPIDSMFGIRQNLEVIIDPDNSENLLISNLSIPVEDDGSFGPDNLSSELSVELFFDDDEIFLGCNQSSLMV
jgi:hypothetical protein